MNEKLYYVSQNLSAIHQKVNKGDTSIAILLGISASHWGALRRGDVEFEETGDKNIENLCHRFVVNEEMLSASPSAFYSCYLDRICERLNRRLQLIHEVVTGRHDEKDNPFEIKAGEQTTTDLLFDLPVEDRDAPLHFRIDSRKKEALIEKGDNAVPVYVEDLPMLRNVVTCMEINSETV